ncbi:hypothetical protein [Cupriavidus necator]|uniref:hypothetical protein n=1 Tax=Cupriavidus necator TaxID=106590 RepID=UPI0005B4AE77
MRFFMWRSETTIAPLRVSPPQLAGRSTFEREGVLSAQDASCWDQLVDAAVQVCGQAGNTLLR